MILVNLLLLVSAVREVPCQTLPWLCANSVIIVIAMVSQSLLEREKRERFVRNNVNIKT